MQVLQSVWQFVRARPANTACTLLLTVGVGFSAWNALYAQENIHPAPLWGNVAPSQNVTPPVVETAPEAVPQRPASQAAPKAAPALVTDSAPTSSITTPATIPAETTGNPQTFMIQKNLAKLGFFSEKVDGYYGPKTAAAIRAFEAQYGMESTGAISDEVATKLDAVAGQQGQASTPKATVAPQASQNTTATADPLAQIAMSAQDNAPAVAPVSRDYVLKIQKGLYSLGFLEGAIDGVAGDQTARAIRQFEVFNNYRESGEITPELYDMLLAANAKFD